jgi:quinol monooxygenase YgiN
MTAVIITYVVKKGCEKEFERILRKHWKVLRAEGFVTGQVPFLLLDPENPMVYKEILQWKNKRAMQKAHESHRVEKIWNQMKKLTEEGGIEPAHFNSI